MSIESGEHGPVVVGIDGSMNALTAVRWAAAEAANRRAPLRIVHVCLPALGQAPPNVPPPMADMLVAAGNHWLTEAATEARRIWDDVTTALVRDDEIRALLNESRSARLMVLGARGYGGFAELLLGSVALTVSARGGCPMVVVRGEDEDRTGRPIVVGVDGSRNGDAAVVFAFEEAQRRSVPLVAVHTWTDTPAATAFAMAPFAVDWSDLHHQEQLMLEEHLDGWQDKYPDVLVRRVVSRDRPAHSLLQQARAAQLVVVGTRGHGNVAGLVLGSTSRALLNHAPCPVAVVRAN